MIHQFIKHFTDHRFDNIVKQGNDYFLVHDNLTDLKEKIPLETFSQGIFLGRQKSKQFYPSPALIDLISKHSTRKVFVNDKAEWLFLCKKDVFGKSIVKANIRRGLCLVQNRIDENLGFGRIVAPLDRKDMVVVKNILDKGEWLRMER
ncbi:hypothetical protein KY337_01630 [Candidatus Woesearchaeota archaeon]|nr:hypothetical protein [Candidatus Woesearchaeota archaeon]